MSRDDHEMEVAELRNKIKFLIHKIELLEDQITVGKQSFGGISNQSAEMIQSKMLQSNTSIDSFRFTPNSSVVSNRDFPTRRNTSNAKTPTKCPPPRITKSFAPLLEKNC